MKGSNIDEVDFIAYMVIVLDGEEISHIATTDESGGSWAMFPDISASVQVAQDLKESGEDARILKIHIRKISTHDVEGRLVA